MSNRRFILACLALAISCVVNEYAAGEPRDKRCPCPSVRNCQTVASGKCRGVHRGVDEYIACPHWEWMDWGNGISSYYAEFNATCPDPNPGWDNLDAASNMDLGQPCDSGMCVEVLGNPFVSWIRAEANRKAPQRPHENDRIRGRDDPSDRIRWRLRGSGRKRYFRNEDGEVIFVRIHRTQYRIKLGGQFGVWRPQNVAVEVDPPDGWMEDDPIPSQFKAINGVTITDDYKAELSDSTGRKFYLTSFKKLTAR